MFYQFRLKGPFEVGDSEEKVSVIDEELDDDVNAVSDDGFSNVASIADLNNKLHEIISGQRLVYLRVQAYPGTKVLLQGQNYNISPETQQSAPLNAAQIINLNSSNSYLLVGGSGILTLDFRLFKTRFFPILLSIQPMGSDTEYYASQGLIISIEVVPGNATEDYVTEYWSDFLTEEGD